jgi:hypothetical protein
MKDDYAFPRVTQLGQMAPGMELRDWFASMALQGILANEALLLAIPCNGMPENDYAQFSYDIADAMIEHRNKEQNNDV